MKTRSWPDKWATANWSNITRIQTCLSRSNFIGLTAYARWTVGFDQLLINLEPDQPVWIHFNKIPVASKVYWSAVDLIVGATSSLNTLGSGPTCPDHFDTLGFQGLMVHGWPNHWLLPICEIKFGTGHGHLDLFPPGLYWLPSFFGLPINCLQKKVPTCLIKIRSRPATQICFYLSLLASRAQQSAVPKSWLLPAVK